MTDADQIERLQRRVRSLRAEALKYKGLYETAECKLMKATYVRQVTIDMLKRIVEGSPETSVGPADDLGCFFCGQYFNGYEQVHEPDCLYVEAKAYLESLESTNE